MQNIKKLIPIKSKLSFFKMDYYAVLGLSKGASSDEVKKAFKKRL